MRRAKVHSACCLPARRQRDLAEPVFHAGVFAKRLLEGPQSPESQDPARQPLQPHHGLHYNKTALRGLAAAQARAAFAYSNDRFTSAGRSDVLWSQSM